MNELTELLERVKAATGPDRELDAAVKLAAAACMIAGGRSQQDVVAAAGGNLFDEAPLYTASVDAALALTKHCGFVLGKWNYTMAAAYGSFSIIPNDPHSAGIHDKRCGHARGAPTIPLAILAALLSALIAQDASS